MCHLARFAAVLGMTLLSTTLLMPHPHRPTAETGPWRDCRGSIQPGHHMRRSTRVAIAPPTATDSTSRPTTSDCTGFRETGAFHFHRAKALP